MWGRGGVRVAVRANPGEQQTLWSGDILALESAAGVARTLADRTGWPIETDLVP